MTVPMDDALMELIAASRAATAQLAAVERQLGETTQDLRRVSEALAGKASKEALGRVDEAGQALATRVTILETQRAEAAASETRWSNRASVVWGLVGALASAAAGVWVLAQQGKPAPQPQPAPQVQPLPR